MQHIHHAVHKQPTYTSSYQHYFVLYYFPVTGQPLGTKKLSPSCYLQDNYASLLWGVWSNQMKKKPNTTTFYQLGKNASKHWRLHYYCKNSVTCIRRFKSKKETKNDLTVQHTNIILPNTRMHTWARIHVLTHCLYICLVSLMISIKLSCKRCVHRLWKDLHKIPNATKEMGMSILTTTLPAIR